MTIFSPQRFHEWPPAGYDGQFHWNFLFSAFPRGIKPMDWDGVVETNYRWLVFETKEPGKDVPAGQRICLEHAVETGYFTVFLLFGKTPVDIQEFEIWFRNKDGLLEKRKKTGNSEEVLRYVRYWIHKYDNNRVVQINNDGKLNLETCDQCGHRLEPLVFI